MSKKISNLSFNDFNISGEFSETLPKYRKNLLYHFPFDGSAENRMSCAEIYVENNTIQTRGNIPNIIKTNSNVLVSNGVMKFTGAINCFLDLNPSILNGVDDFEIEIKFKETTSNVLGCLIHVGRNVVGKEETFTLIIKNNTRDIYSDMSNLTNEPTITKNTYPMTNPGDVNINTTHTLKICRKNNIITSYLDDVFKKMNRAYGIFSVDRLIIGQEVDGPVLNNTFDINQSFIGDIEYIKFKKFEIPFVTDQKVSDLGFIGNANSINIGDTGIGVYNNFKYPASLIATNTKFLGHEIKRLNIAINTDVGISTLRSSQPNSIGINSELKETYKANTKYCAYMFFKPISHSDIRLCGVASNIQGWTVGKITELSDGWFMYYQYRDGTVTVEQQDYVFFSCSSQLVKLNDEIIVEVSPIIILEGCEVPGAFEIKPNSTVPSASTVSILHSFINPIINDFSYSFEWTPISHTTEALHPQLLWAGNWSDPVNQDWLGLYRGKAWDPKRLTVSYSFLETMFSYSPGSIDISNSISNNIYIGVSYNKTLKKITVVIYDKTLKKYLFKDETSNPKFILNQFTYAGLNLGTGDIMKNLSIYNKALAVNEFEENYIEKFSMSPEGNISLSSINEICSNVPRENIYYSPLDTSTKSICGRLDRVAANAEPSYVEGGALVGDIKADLVIDLTRSQSLSATDLPWDKNLHSDAYSVSGWATGYNPGVTEPLKGYHAKWVKEGPSGNICLKIIDHNTQYGQPHRWNGTSRVLQPTDFGLLNTCIVGTKITISFKARAEINDSYIQVGFHRYQISSNTYNFGPQIKEVKLSTSWEEYCIDFTVDSDWDLTKQASLYFYGYLLHAFETTTYVTDVVLIKNGPSISSEVAYNLKPGQSLDYNLNSSIGLDWSKPWQICYWKKPLSSAKTSLYSLDSLGEGNVAGKGYTYLGHFNTANNIVWSTYIRAINSDTEYYNNWIFVSIRYNGTNLTVEQYGETIKFKETLVTTIPSSDFFVSTQGRDLMLGGFRYGGDTTSASLYKDLVIIKSSILTDAETLKLANTKLSYKNNKLIANCELKESLI